MKAELVRMREILRAALPERAFLRRDRGEALFITNAPAFAPDIAPVPGFRLIPGGGMLRILPEAGWMEELERNYPRPPDEFCRSMERFRGREPGQAELLLFARGLKLIDMGGSAPQNESASFDRALRQHAALALRGAADGGGLYALAILNHQILKGE